MKLFHAAAFVAALAAVACGHSRPETTAAKTISTDLPDTGHLGPMKMYWVEKGQIFRGTCDDKTLVLEANCQNAVEVMDYAQFQLKLDNGLRANIDGLTDQVEQIEAAIDAVEGEIHAATDALGVYEAKLGQSTIDMNEARQELGVVSTWIGAYRAQLAAIKAKLKTVRNSDLQEQSEQMSGELQQLLDEARALCGKIAGLQSRIDYFASVIAEITDSLRALSTRLANLQSDYTETSAELQRACDDLASYKQTIGMLTDAHGIDYRVQAENSWFQNARRFVKRFDEIFVGAKKV